MAKRKAKKMQPAVTRLWFKIKGGTDQVSTTITYCDISLACSAVNRRFYRQGLKWAVAGMKLHTPAETTGTFKVSKVPDTWIAANAHTKVKKLWMESQSQVTDVDPSIKAKYRDFKVYLDAQNGLYSTVQGAGPTGATQNQFMLPIDSLDNAVLPGEWVYSTIQMPQLGGSAPPEEVHMIMVGDNNTGGSKELRGIIHGYGMSRARPMLDDPNVPPAGWLNDVFDVAEVNDAIRTDLIDNNDSPPYRVTDADSLNTEEHYPGGANNHAKPALHTKGFVTSSTVGGMTPIEGGIFNLGLIRFDWELQLPPSEREGELDDFYLSVDLVPGTHKGYLAEAY